MNKKNRKNMENWLKQGRTGSYRLEKEPKVSGKYRNGCVLPQVTHLQHRIRKGA